MQKLVKKKTLFADYTDFAGHGKPSFRVQQAAPLHLNFGLQLEVLCLW